MTNLANPILNFRLPADEQPDDEEIIYDLTSGEHTIANGQIRLKLSNRNSQTMITLTREAADATESAG